MLSRTVRLFDSERISRYLRLCGISFISISAFLAYQYLVYATKPSPLLNIGFNETSRTLIQLLLIASILGLILSTLYLITESILGKSGQWLTSAFSIFCMAIAIAIGIENFIYTVFGSGMKSTNFIVLKILVVYMSMRISTDVFRKLSRCDNCRLTRWSPIIFGLAALAILNILHGHFSAPKDSSRPALATHRPNIIILSSDGIDAERMGIYGYSRETTPFLSSKAGELALYTNAFTNNAHTTGSIVSMLTGMSPVKSGVIYPPDMLRGQASTRGLPQLLGSIGYNRTNWSVSYYSDAQSQNMVGAFDSDNDSKIFPVVTMLLPESHELSRWLISAVTKEVRDIISGAFLFQEIENPFNLVSNQESFTQDARNLQGLLNDIDGSEPFFINTHFMMTHGEIFPVKNPFFSKGKQQTTKWMPDFYDDAIRDFDAIVKTVYEHLEHAGKLDNTIIVITSDHGSQWSKLKRTPLMIRFPGGSHAGSYQNNVQRLDIAPTLATYLGIPHPLWMEGMSLLEKNIPANRTIMAYGVLDRVGVAHNQLGHTGHTSNLDNHSITLIQCNNAYTIDSTSLNAVANQTSPEALEKDVTVTRIRNARACAANDEIDVRTAINEILKKLHI